ncbi:MAG TPA: hypothetical protein VN408_15165 [Actinoplanes sp.]|nr:hypothetical protein [Actinoplanes sp.]
MVEEWLAVPVDNLGAADEEDEAEARQELSSSLAQLSALRLGTPQLARKLAREAVEVLDPLPSPDPLVRGMAGLALARACLLVEGAIAELSRGVTIFDEEAGGIGRWPSVSLMQAEAESVRAGAYLAVNRPAAAQSRATAESCRRSARDVFRMVCLNATGGPR